MTITNGSVSFEQSKKLAEYENRKATVTFNVTNEAGAEDEVIGAMTLAQSVVWGSLGLKVDVNAAKAKAEDTTDKDALKAEHAAKEEAKAKPVSKKKAPVVMVEVDPAAVTDEPQIRSNPEDRKPEELMEDPAAVTDEFSAEPETVTDKAMHEAVTRKNAKLVEAEGAEGTKKIRVLISTFVAHPKGLKDIPADARAAFLKKLEELS